MEAARFFLINYAEKGFHWWPFKTSKGTSSVPQPCCLTSAELLHFIRACCWIPVVWEGAAPDDICTQTRVTGQRATKGQGCSSSTDARKQGNRHSVTLSTHACKIHIKALTYDWIKPSLRLLESHSSGGEVHREQQPAEHPSLTPAGLYWREQRDQRLTQQQWNALTTFTGLTWWHLGPKS